MIEHVLARYGEISLKGKNRSEFERILLHNMRAVLGSWPQVKLERSGGRVMVTLHGAPWRAVAERLARVFGVVSLSPIEVAPLSLQGITAAAAEVLLREQGKSLTTEGLQTLPLLSFKIEVRRPNKNFPMTSPEIAATIGGSLLESVPGLQVNVHTPQVIVYVEVRHREAFVYGEKVRAVGGLPVGSAGTVGLLLSGGIDSPVAGWMSLKRGVTLECIHFQSYPFTSERALQKVESLSQLLANWGGRVRLHTVYFTEVQIDIHKYCPDALEITVMRRMMLRIAQEIARRSNWLALVTGDSLGQVASQTLESLYAINAVTSLPVLRPLIAEDKVDIMAKARMIGSYETSILPYEDCCTVFTPKNPRTRPTLAETERAESELDISRLVAEAVERTTVKTFLAHPED
ncbi:tRNA 4-thiouridine(8) synthase ThiI [Alicyclobacillaceae bacterium I2511]|nr:tRNA 4-thiouridine(8) synthase ThiI [Alicyclobacillaceae bacterium I2511]